MDILRVEGLGFAVTVVVILVVVGIVGLEELEVLGAVLVVEVLVDRVTLDTEGEDRLDDEVDELLGEVEDELDTITLLTEPPDRVQYELNTSTLLTELLDRVEEELDTGPLLTKLLGRVEEQLHTGTLLAKLLMMDVLPDAVEGESVDEIAYNATAGLSAGELEIDVVGMGSAQLGAAIASPEARTAMEVLRPACMVTGDRLCCNEKEIRIQTATLCSQGNIDIWAMRTS